MPEFYTPENNFSLSSGSDNQISYSGSLLIWNPEAKEEHVAKVLSKSVETKLADAQYKKIAFFDDYLWQKYIQIDQDLSILQKN